MEEEDFPPAVGNLQPCRICGRTFNPETLRRHEGICKKNASKTRKTFQSGKQRAVSDAPAIQKKTVKSSNREAPVKSNKNNWRQKHEEFLRTVQAARGVTKALKEGKELPPPPPPTINPDYVQCPHCMRRFNEHAAERHITFCADQHKRLETRVKAKTATTSRAAEKQDRRISYRPPMPSSGLRRTVNLSGTASGYSSSGTQARGQQRTSTKRNGAIKMTERSKTDVFRNRFNDDSTFDTSLPASAVVTTRTGLKARVLASNSSSDIDSSDFDVPKRGPGRRAPAPSSNKRDGYNNYYQPSSNKDQSTRSLAPTHTVTKYDWDFNFDDSNADAVKRNGTRKNTNSRSRQESGFARNNGFSSTNRVGNEHSHPERDYENSLNDFVAREFGSKYKSESQQNGTHAYEQRTSPFSDFTVNNNRYRGQGEPAPIVSKDTSFASDGSRDSYVSTKPQNPTSRFCHECGSRYPVQTAKFCCECGMRRIHI